MHVAGCGILEFATEELAKKAVEKMHRHELRGRKLVVKEDFDTERDRYLANLLNCTFQVLFSLFVTGLFDPRIQFQAGTHYLRRRRPAGPRP